MKEKSCFYVVMIFVKIKFTLNNCPKEIFWLPEEIKSVGIGFYLVAIGQGMEAEFETLCRRGD
jgi:hypothetical protein